MNISSKTKLANLLIIKGYLESLDLEGYDVLDSIELVCENSKDTLFLYVYDNKYSTIQSSGILDFEYLQKAFPIDTAKEMENEQIEEVTTEAKDSSKDYLLSFNTIEGYKDSPVEIIKILNEIECLPNYIGYLDWNLAEQKIPFALIYEQPPNSETFGSWISSQLKELSQKHDKEAIKLATDTLEQLFEALGVSLGELHNQIFKLSAFGNPKCYFNSATYKEESYQNFGDMLHKFKELDKFPINNIIESLNLNFEGSISLGIEIKCHGNLDLNKVYKTTKGLKITCFDQVDPFLASLRRSTDTPLNDVADILISIKTLKESSEGQMIANIDEVISAFENSFLNAYLSFIHFPFPEPYEALLKAKLIERAFVKAFSCFATDDENNEDIYQSILKSLII